VQARQVRILGAMTTARITAEDVLRPGSPWRDHEIWDGVPLLREPCGGQAEDVSARVLVPLGAHVYARKLGRVFLSSQGFLLARNPDRLLASDSAYVAAERLPRVPTRGFIELAPDFCIEVRSPTDTWEATVEKCGIWIAHGVNVVWALDPLRRRAAVFRSDGSVEVLRGGGALDADPAVPGFRLALADVFVD